MILLEESGGQLNGKSIGKNSAGGLKSPVIIKEQLGKNYCETGAKVFEKSREEM